MVLFFLIVLLITYGSFYPFEFVRPETNALQELFQTWESYTHQGDILANIVLFVPLGVTGFLMLRPKYKKELAIITILLFGLILGAALQIGQIYLPSRDANLSDAVLNFIGTIIGVMIATILNTHQFAQTGLKSKFSSFPVLLVLSWLAYRLMPLVPSIDLQEIKNSIKPLFLTPLWEPVRIFHDLTAWLIAFYIVSRIQQKYSSIWHFSLGVFLCFSLEIMIVSNTVSLSNVIGAILALVLWWLLFTRIKHPPVLLAVMLLLVLFSSGYSPFVFADSSQPFRFIPFYGFLGGSMLVNTSSLLEKFFLYGSLIWLLQISGLRLWVATLITVIATLMIELGQIFIVDHLAEITDPLLAVSFGWLAFLLTNGNKVIDQRELAIASIDSYQLFTVKIFLDSPYLSQQIKGEVISSEDFPVQIGRSDKRGLSKNEHGYQISLGDIEPYQLSRQHFCIEQSENHVLIRDLNSTNGTLLNEKQLGRKLGAPQSGKLIIGENEVIAGRDDSNFYFRIRLELG